MRGIDYILPFFISASLHVAGFAVGGGGSDAELKIKPGRSALKLNILEYSVNLSSKASATQVATLSQDLPERSPGLSTPSNKPLVARVKQNSSLNELSPDIKGSPSRIQPSNLDQGASSKVKVSGLVMPEYPEDARRKAKEGRVVYKVLVAKEGFVKDIKLEHSSGVASLDKAALKALKKAAFIPAKNFGRAVDSSKLIAFKFNLLED